ncbi:Unconventional myosin-Ie [Thelohanellus kitauei]|uniref:Unconventional myosin-Ie n=1 Tax=Thelohanellus kitauei TaxID=669202 RepID=A0A0C2MB80_THEKT|nr:Unconventional myosin-Ie [Thelohanellus kitauei]
MKVEGVDDMILLTKIEVPEIAENLKKRLMKDCIYTYIGEVLIAVNPFKNLPYFTDKEIEMYQNTAIYENPPHVYHLCDSAFRGLLNYNENQCVIISGESGAGKTVSAKYVMSYITKVSGGGPDVDRVKEIILKSNPLLEAFGNAKTLRNDNSSRFGKYVEIQFKCGGVPKGGRISNFLLEKSRVVMQNKGERGFHIFYQLLAGLTSQEKKELSLTKPDDFKYLCKSECFTIPDVDDAEELKQVKDSFNVVGISETIRTSIFRLMAGILYLGNIQFKEEDNIAVIVDEKPLKLAARFFEVDAEQLLTVITKRNMESKWGAKSEKIQMTHNVEQAIFSRDAIAKAIYFRTFGYLVDV